MPRDERNTLEVLKAELAFLKQDGYNRTPRDPWNAQLPLEDSPTCINYSRKQHEAPCTDCLLMQFVPSDKRNERVPCRHIPVTPQGDTLLQLYRGGTEQEIDDALANWLAATIAQLEKTESKTPSSRAT